MSGQKFSESTGSNKRIAKNTIFLYIRMLVVMIISLYTSRVILKVLGVEDFGIYNVVGSIILMFSFINGTLSSATSRFITVELGKNNYCDLNKIFNITLFCHVAIAMLIVLLGETVGLWYFYNYMVIPAERVEIAFWVYQLSIVASVLTIIQVPYNSLIIARENMKIYAYVGLAESILKLAIVYMLIASPVDRLLSYALLTLFVHFVLNIYFVWYCRSRYPESAFSLNWDKKIFYQLLNFSFASLLSTISVEIQSQGINLLLNFFHGPVVNAARAIAYQVQSNISKFAGNFTTAVKPQIIKLYVQGKTQEMMLLVEMSGNLSCYLLLIFIIPIGLEVQQVLSLWLGNYPNHSTGFLSLIMSQSLLGAYSSVRSGVFAAVGKLYKINIISALILISCLPIAFLFLKLDFEPEWVFVSINITVIIYETVSWIILRQYVGYSLRTFFLNTYCKMAMVTIIGLPLPAMLRMFIPESPLRLISIFVISSISITLSYLYIGLSKANRDRIFTIIKSKLHIL